MLSTFHTAPVLFSRWSDDFSSADLRTWAASLMEVTQRADVIPLIVGDRGPLSLAAAALLASAWEQMPQRCAARITSGFAVVSDANPVLAWRKLEGRMCPLIAVATWDQALECGAREARQLGWPIPLGMPLPRIPPNVFRAPPLVLQTEA